MSANNALLAAIVVLACAGCRHTTTHVCYSYSDGPSQVSISHQIGAK